MILAAVEKQVGGTAASSASSFDKMKFALAGISDTFGELVLPHIDKFSKTLAKASNFVQKNQKLVGILVLTFGGLATGIVAVNVAMKLWKATTAAFTAVQAAFNAVMALNPIFLIVAAVVAIIAILVVLQKEFGIFDGVIRVVGNAFDAVWKAIKTVFEWVTDNWPLLLAVITGPFGLAVLAVVTFKDQITGILGNLIGWIGTAFKTVTNLILFPYIKAFEGIVYFKDLVISIFKKLTELGGSIFDNVGGAFKDVINKVIQSLESGLNFAIDGLNLALDGIDKAAGPLVNFGNIDPIDIPELAEGGIVTSPTLAMIGEGRGPEAVIPLSKLSSMGFGGDSGGTTNITVNVMSADPNEVVRALQAYNRNVGRLPVRVQ
jgi:hypothetical protein